MLVNNPSIAVGYNFSVGTQTTLSGSGAISGNFVNNGEIFVGEMNSTAPGILYFSGRFSQTTGSILYVGILCYMLYIIFYISQMYVTKFYMLSIHVPTMS